MTDKDKFNFIEQIIDGDLKSGKHEVIKTRFPPEPNGYLHIGHAKSIVLNFSLSERFGGSTNLRFDDTNPFTESIEYVNAIKKDIEWLGFQWDGEVKFTSQHFPKLHEYAVMLINKGLAYVDDSTVEEIAEQKGDTTHPGINSPFRSRTIQENLDLFAAMKNGKYKDGEKVLRAKIDMAHPNLHMRDPLIYRIKHIEHHSTGNDWCIYPMYDFAHGQSDSLENITHSICTLEFENHRPLYDWFIENLSIFPSRQIEFSRLNLTYTIISKRKLLRLVNENFVSGWNDPRMPTISGMRRRGYPAQAIKNFASNVGVTKRSQFIDMSRLEDDVRKVLNLEATRVMAVINPVKVIITNYEEGKVEILKMLDQQSKEDPSYHEMPFSREIYIDRSDFMEDPPKKFFRLGPDRNVRLKGAYILHCEDYKKDDEGNIVEIYCTYYKDSKSGQDKSGIKAKGVLQWVSIEQAVDATIYEYDRLFKEEFPEKQDGIDFVELYNENSLVIRKNIKIEPYLAKATIGTSFQFMRIGYFTLDEKSTSENIIFNRTVSLRDAWNKKK